MSYLSQPLQGFVTRLPFGLVINPVVASGSADALPVANADVFVTRAGVDAMTLATPKAGVYQTGAKTIQSLGDPADDGKELLVYSTTAQAHTITTAANKINGSLHIATFAAAVGNYIRFKAFNGIWYVLDSKGITLS
jgi:hypothetical protein